ncbi:diguanylate cyclase (GGDEF) domain-containing protein [Peptoclostridium litorale DSM 5388]|uniref:Phytochrome-like protein Cph2 n=1 Tax=Peptoclostridium litorale DSM 5388 TaxID=1121324 RepID=A0A069RGU4_PEPLI|nr:diguanylate cyclase [Peptoclostridium litorale]KDR96254.1 phytochrome-like protein Cph2 [Peptoclostridium litorale DSM 5388]SIO14555.1 diguanylate cyclase (GGDEF) domain-containing protein [Peptoclostridium litorale DSM 5388]
MKRLGFSKQIVLLLMSLVVICIALTEVISYNMTSDLNNRLVMENLQTLTDSTYNLIDSSVNVSIKNYLKAIAEKNKNIVELYYGKFMKGELSETEAKQAVANIFETQSIGETGYIYIVDSKGVLVEHPALRGADISNYDFTMMQIEKKEGYMEYLWKNPADDREREKVLYMVYFEPWDYIISVTSYKSDFIDLIDTNDFKDNILSVEIGKTGYMHVMNSQGELIIHPKQQGVSIYDSVDTAGNHFIQEIIKNKNGSIVYPWKNPGELYYRNKIVIYKYYEPMDWYLCSGVYIGEITEPVELMQRKMITVFILIFVVTAVIALIYSRIILKPINQLILAMEKVISGEFDINIDSNRNDEIGRLTNIFNDMIYKVKNYMDRLSVSNSRLEEINETLENKVKERTCQLELLSNQDGLTGLFNRRKLDEYLEQSWTESLELKEPLTLLLIDIDHFKGYNDTYGHPAGDECLKAVAGAINEMSRKEIDFVARYGGEEFLVVLNDTDRDTGVDVAEQIRKAIEDLKIPHISSAVSDYVTASIGACTLSGFENSDLKGFVELTDEALYNAKTAGRNRVKVNSY